MKPSRSLLLVAALYALPLAAQNQVTQQDQPGDPHAILAAERYQKPPAVVERIVAANRNAEVSLGNPSPDHKWFLRVENDGLPSLDDFAKGHIYLGGLQVDTAAFRARALTTRPNKGITIIEGATGKARTLETLPGAAVSAASWSPDGKMIAYVASTPKATHLAVIDVATGKSTQLTKTPINAVWYLAGGGGGGGFGGGATGVEWTNDSKSVVAVLVPQPMRAKPVEPAVATTPIVRITQPGVMQKESIHPSLLTTPYDMQNLEYYSTGQLALIDVKSKAVKTIGTPAMIQGVNPSPDGQYFRVTLLDKPFSYIVPTANFGTEEQLWDATGKMVAQINKRPMRSGTRITDSATQVADSIALANAGVDPMLKGKTILGWDPAGGGMYVVAVDPAADSAARASQSANAGRGGRGNGGGRGGNGGGQGPQVPSKLQHWAPPFSTGVFHDVYASNGRISTASWTPDHKTLFLTVGNTSYAMRMADTTKHLALQNVTLGGGGGRGRGGAGGGRGAGPGNPLLGTVAMNRGYVAIGTDNKTVFLTGTKNPGANWEKESPVSWVDKLDIETGTRARIFEGSPNGFDAVVSPVDQDYSKFLITHESPTDVPNTYLVDAATKQQTKLTDNKDYAPEVTQAIRKRLWATRPDGFRFEVDVTLPKDYKEGTKLPGLIWFYPTEVVSQELYDQGRQSTNINRFPQVGPRSAEIWTTQGYVVLQPQAIPVAGPEGKMNDHYIDELRDGLAATIDAAVNAGYLDRDRVGLWGHSYGAFSTVNAMTHTKWFKAGIAGDGMYNRSLTPYGFQNERRDFWQAQDVYLKMSPFFYADQLSGALLMYHQTEDQNVGTDPISSIRMFHALQGQGKTAALFMYPYEDHGPATKETDLDQWARFIAWFDIYVKNAKTKAAVVP